MQTWSAGMSTQPDGRHTLTAILPGSPPALLPSGRISAFPMYRSTRFLARRLRVSAACEGGMLLHVCDEWRNFVRGVEVLPLFPSDLPWNAS